MYAEKDLKRRIRSTVRALVKEFDLEWITWSIAFETTMDNDRVTCTTEADWEYRQVTLKWNLPMVATLSPRKLEGIAIHEIVHGLNAPVYKSLSESQREKLHEVNELATENVARVIARLRRRGTPR